MPKYIYRIGKDIYDAATQKVLTPTQFGSGAGYTELSAIPGSFNTKEAQQANYDQIMPIGNTLYGIPKTKPVVAQSNVGPGQYIPGVGSKGNVLDTQTMQVGSQTGDIGLSLPSKNAADMAQGIYATNAASTAEKTLADLNKQLNELKAQQLKDISEQKALADKELKDVQAKREGAITDYDTTMKPLVDQSRGIYQNMLDSISGVNYKSLVEQKLSLTQDIVNYSKLMQENLETEAGRPAMLDISEGRQNVVKQTYLSKITTAQAAMSAIDGNFSLAFDIMDKGANAINQLTNDRINFLNSVKGIYDQQVDKAEDKLLSLTADEKAAIETAITDLNVQIEAVEANKQKIMELMQTNPIVAQKAGLALTDSQEVITQKLVDFYNKFPQYTPENQDWIKKAMEKYYDAGITLNDPVETVKSKIANSKTYQNDNRLSVADAIALLQGNYQYDDSGNLVTNVSNATVDQIADAIKQIESGGNYEAKGASGENGAYQFMPSTWAGWSSQYASQVLQKSVKSLPMTPENQDAVAKWKIQSWLSQGYAPEQIASLWNSGSPDWQGKVGKNKMGVNYNVPAYVDKFRNALTSIIPGTETTLTKEQRTTVDQIANDVRQDADIKDFITIRDGYERVQSGAQMDNAQGDLSLLFGYMKLLDPNSVVRETEFANAEQAQGTLQKWFNFPNKFIKGERLTSEARKHFSEAAFQLYEQKRQSYDRAVEFYSNRAERSGVDPNLVLRDFTSTIDPLGLNSNQSTDPLGIL